MKFYMWVLAKADRYGIKLVRGFKHDDRDTSWAEGL